MTAEDLIYILYDYFNVTTNVDLAEKLNTTQQTITNWKTRNSINAIKKKCRELGIFNDIFRDTQINSIQGSTINGSGVNNGKNKTNMNQIDTFEECDDFTKSLFIQLCKKYKNNQSLLQNKIFTLIQDESN